jgi:hypothetical protein
MWKSILEKSVCVHNAVFSSCENRRKSTTSFLNHQIKIGKILPKITFYSNKHPFYNNSLPQRHLYIDINSAQYSCLHQENLLRILVLSVPQKEIVFHTEDIISHRNHRNHRNYILNPHGKRSLSAISAFSAGNNKRPMRDPCKKRTRMTRIKRIKSEKS